MDRTFSRAWLPSGHKRHAREKGETKWSTPKDGNFDPRGIGEAKGKISGDGVSTTGRGLTKRHVKRGRFF